MPPPTKLAHQVVAAAIWKSKIADEQVEAVLIGQLQCRGNVSRFLDRVAVRSQHHAYQFRGDIVVFDQQDAQGPEGALPGRSRFLGLVGRRAKRQTNAKRRTLVPAFAVD